MPCKRLGQRSAGVADKIKNGGLVEVPMGISLRSNIRYGRRDMRQEVSCVGYIGKQRKLHRFD